MNIKPVALIVCALFGCLASTSALAQDARTSLIQRIAEAQGLTKLFDQQLVVINEAMRTLAKGVIDRSVQSGRQPDQKEQAAFKRFESRNANMFSSKEIVAAWTARYGHEMSIQELEEVLRYYESPVGRKDVAANQEAMPGFSNWMARETDSRTTSLAADFIAELKAARQVSSPRESHPQALPEPDVNLSIHPAPIVQSS